MKVGRVAIITRGRYAGKKVCEEIILPLSYTTERICFLWFWNRWMTQFSGQSVHVKLYRCGWTGFSALNSPNSFICLILTNHMTDRSSYFNHKTLVQNLIPSHTPSSLASNDTPQKLPDAWARNGSRSAQKSSPLSKSLITITWCQPGTRLNWKVWRVLCRMTHLRRSHRERMRRRQWRKHWKIDTLVVRTVGSLHHYGSREWERDSVKEKSCLWTGFCFSYDDHHGFWGWYCMLKV